LGWPTWLARLRISSHQIDDLMCLTKKRKKLMSKKLFAAATAAALALTALVGVAPASANYTFSVTATGQTSTDSGLVESAPLAINVPSQDVLRLDESTPAAAASVTASVIRLDIQASTTSAAVRVVTTGGVKVLSETQWSATTKRTATGTASLDTTSGSSNGRVNVYIYSTSTTVGTVTITQGGNSRVLYVDGKNLAGYAYNVNFKAPATADVSGHVLFTGTVTDVFGNPIAGASASVVTLSAFGVASSGVTIGTGDNAWTESSTTPGTYTFGLPTSSTAGSAAYGIATGAAAPTKPTNLAAPAWTQFLTVTTASLSAQVTSLQASVDSLTKSVAALTADYNSVAKKYNKLVKKSKRVALK
jgi:hypothetical protein